MAERIDTSELVTRFRHHEVDERRARLMTRVRGECLELAMFLVAELPPCRETSRAVNALEDAMFHANAAIARRGTQE